ncbi:MAG: portal protein [Burkholderiaceae bacterium]
MKGLPMMNAANAAQLDDDDDVLATPDSKFLAGSTDSTAPIGGFGITSAEKLTDWKNPPRLADLKKDLEEALPSHSTQKSKIEAWLDNMNVEGKAKIKTPEGSSAIQPKLIRKQAEWRYPALSEPFLSEPDLFTVAPATWRDTKAAQQNELVLNHQFSTKIDRVAFIDEYVRTAVDEGTVIVRLGWKYAEEQYEEEVPDVQFVANPDAGPLHDQLAQMKATQPEQYEEEVPEQLKQAHELTLQHGVPYQPQVIGRHMETKTRVTENGPTLEVCDYRNVVVDPTCRGDVAKANFIVYSFTSSLSQLKKDGKYKNLDQIQPNNSSILGDPDHAPTNGETNFQFADQARKKFVVYEYWGNWDITGTGVVEPIVAAWVGNVMIRLEKNPFPDKKHPFVSVQYLPVRRAVHGEPDGELLADNQKIIGAVTRGMIDILGKSANGQTGMRKDMLDQTNKLRFQKGLDYEFNANVDPRIGVYMHTFPEIPQSAQFMLQHEQMEAESMTGVKVFSEGVSGNSLGQVAAGVRGALDAASKRELGILRRLSNGIVEIGRKIIAMNGEFLSAEEVIRITDEEFVTVKRDDLPGNFDLKLTISTAEEDAAKAQNLAFLLQTTGNNMGGGLMQKILGKICRLHKMPELAHDIETYQPQPDPLQQKKAQLEVELLAAQVEKERAQAQHYLAGSQLQATKVGTEQAKAGHLQAATDKTNLDFVEQESGVKQERDLQKQGEQAKAQAGLAAVQHGFNMREKKVDLLKDFLLAGKKS